MINREVDLIYLKITARLHVMMAGSLTCVITCSLSHVKEVDQWSFCNVAYLYKRNEHPVFLSHSVMESPNDWDALLEKKYPSYKVEVEAFLESLDVANLVLMFQFRLFMMLFVMTAA